jgi:ArsR family transcriptional regulator
MNNIKLESLFNALSDANRIKILTIISASKDICGCDILKELNITQPTLTYHMKILQEAGLITCSKKGTWCIYEIANDELTKMNIFIESLIKEDN